MGNLLRLDSKSLSLAEAFRQANDDQRRHAALTVCLVAAVRVELQGDEIDAAINLLRHGENAQPDLRHKLESLTAQFDEQYFKLSRKADATTPQALLVFRKARAAAALAFALSSVSGRLQEAVYEAIVASDDRVEAIRTVEDALRAR